MQKKFALPSAHYDISTDRSNNFMIKRLNALEGAWAKLGNLAIAFEKLGVKYMGCGKPNVFASLLRQFAHASGVPSQRLSCPSSAPREQQQRHKCNMLTQHFAKLPVNVGKYPIFPFLCCAKRNLHRQCCPVASTKICFANP